VLNRPMYHVQSVRRPLAIKNCHSERNNSKEPFMRAGSVTVGRNFTASLESRSVRETAQQSMVDHLHATRREINAII